MILRALELADMETIRRERNAALATLRTPFPLTREQQEEWYRTEICNRNSRSRFWAIADGIALVGYGGIESIQWENGIGEISLLISRDYQGRGWGLRAARAIIDSAFLTLGLFTVYAECYLNNPAVKFWRKVFSEYESSEVTLPNRKYCEGRYHDSAYFSASHYAS